MADSERGTGKDDITLDHREVAGYQSHVPKVPALHHDVVAPEAIGGLYEEMPKGYYWSKDFIGTLIVSCFISLCRVLSLCPRLMSARRRV